MHRMHERNLTHSDCCPAGLHPASEVRRVLHTDGYWRNVCRLCTRERERKFRERNPGYVTAATRKYRSDPDKRERDRERSRRWKREHLGQSGLPRKASA